MEQKCSFYFKNIIILRFFRMYVFCRSVYISKIVHLRMRDILHIYVPKYQFATFLVNTVEEVQH